MNFSRASTSKSGIGSPPLDTESSARLRRLDSPQGGLTVGVAGKIPGRVKVDQGHAFPAIGRSPGVFRVEAEPLAKGDRPVRVLSGEDAGEPAGFLDPVTCDVQAAQQAAARAAAGELEVEPLDRADQAQVEQAGDR